MTKCMYEEVGWLEDGRAVYRHRATERLVTRGGGHRYTPLSGREALIFELDWLSANAWLAIPAKHACTDDEVDTLYWRQNTLLWERRAAARADVHWPARTDEEQALLEEMGNEIL